MHRFSTYPARRTAGFTLIEVMIAVVVVAILATIAYPSYVNHVQATRRAEGKAALLNAAQRLERCYTRFGAYNAGGCDVAFPFDTEEGNYTISLVARTPASFTLAATPKNAQANDAKCGQLRLTSTGQQGSLGNSATDANDCW